MSNSINSVCLSGNLTRDCEVRRTQGGMAIVNFSIAVNDRRKNSQTGEWEDYASYVDVTWFGKYAEACSASLAKGTKVALSGKLRQDRWERDGQKHSKLSVIADEVAMPARQQSQQQDYYDDDLPF